MRLVDYAERRFRLAGSQRLGDIEHFMGSFDQLPWSDGRPPVSFGHYDYLGLGADSRVRQAASDYVLECGVGAGASRLVGGERDIHCALEADLARFVGTEGTLCLVSGYLTNVTLVSHLLGTRDLLLIDDLSHNSLVFGASTSRATTKTFRHNDLGHLEQILAAERGRHCRCLVVVEGLYSMDGDIPDLPRLLEIKHRHDAWLLVDEAHSLGVLGRTGRGLSEHWGTDPCEIDLIVGTLSKSLASCGGFVAAAASVLAWFRYTLPGFVFSVGMSPLITVATHTALEMMRAEPWRTVALQANSRCFAETACELGLDIGQALGRGVVPVLFRDNEETVACANALLNAGFYCPPIVHVGVPRDRPRLRFFLSALHHQDDIRRALDVVAGTIEMHRNGRRTSALGPYPKPGGIPVLEQSGVVSTPETRL
jgi:7-keto-8-aminopelargonate synthetase-like enzyme